MLQQLGEAGLREMGVQKNVDAHEEGGRDRLMAPWQLRGY